MLADNGQKKQRCCSACDIGKGCIRKSEEKEDVQMLVAKPSEREQDLESESDSSSTEIKKKEKNYIQGSDTFSQILGRTRSQQQRVIQAPLHQAVRPEGLPVFVRVQFTTSDLLKWKQSVGSYQDDPEKMHRLGQTIVMNHKPTWRDMQTLLNTLFSPEEKKLVLEKSKEENERQNVKDHLLLDSCQKWAPAGIPILLQEG